MPVNHHGSLVLAGDRGIFIIGPSGSGKTNLALALLGHCLASGRFARLVADDQILLSVSGGRLIGRAPSTIGGFAEARGFGPASLPHEPAALLDLVVRLVPAPAAPRFQQGETVTLEGVDLPCLDLAEREAGSAVLAISAMLSLPPFG
ncbi:HPr kinase/phosphatase C-terminal domain-containing protein [Chelativorans sp.]|uniref:HPr kinase/phosphorylase n=1 Tax=Chelativorans sp. TaxID=2203393 RepID=UPI0028126DFA|nr:HPr kinase/phosphatase C-terminal domain-containing protein [Chelativorans sp.]